MKTSLVVLTGMALAALLLENAAAQTVFNIRNFGATGNGSTIDSGAINNAITAANANAGGGIVQFPSGQYRCHSIHLKSNVTLQLDSGAVILATSSGMDSPESNQWDNY